MNKLANYIKSLFTARATGTKSEPTTAEYQQMVFAHYLRQALEEDSSLHAQLANAARQLSKPKAKPGPRRIRITAKGRKAGKFVPLSQLPKHTIRVELPGETKAAIQAASRQIKAGPPPEINTNWATAHAANMYQNGRH